MDPNDLKKLEERVNAKVTNVARFVWLVVLVFLMVGAFTPMRERVALGMVLFTLGWVMTRVLREGIDATKALFFSKSENDNNSNKEE